MTSFLRFSFRYPGLCQAGIGLLCLCGSLGVLDAADLTRPTAIAPIVAPASDEPTEMMSGIRIPEGWKIELFAAEPEVANIVAFDIDDRGRFFVCETYRQNRGVTDNRAHDEAWTLADLAAETVQDRIDYHKRLLGDAAITYAQHDDRIRRVVDSNGDGKADESTILVDGFNALEMGTGAGVLAVGSDVYYTNIPKLWKLTDANDDGVADERAALSDGYGVRVAFRGHDMHGLIRGYDGRLYFSIGDRGYHVATAEGNVLANPAVGAVFRCELDGSKLEVFANGLRNPQELAFNDVGDWYTVDNNSDSGDQARVVRLLQGGDSGWRMHYQYLPDRGPFNRLNLWKPLHDEQPAHIVPPIANLTDGPSGFAYYPGSGFGDQLDNRFLICDFRGGASNSGIRSFRLEPSGAFDRLAEDQQPIWNILATDLAFGPGGELFVSDWVDGWDGVGKGRIYRLTDPRSQGDPIVAEVKSLLADDITTRGEDELLADLKHRDRRVRLRAQWELASRGESEALQQLASDLSFGTVARLHGIWGAEHAVRLHPELRESFLQSLQPLLRDPDAIVAAAACSVCGDQGGAASISTLSKLINAPEPRVRYHATMAAANLVRKGDPGIGEDQIQEVFNATTQLLVENANSDPALRHAGIQVYRQVMLADPVFNLKNHADRNVRRAAVAALRSREDERLADFLDDSDAIVVREAAMAIHDQPIPAALDALADVIERDLVFSTDQDALIRSVLSANYKIGTAATAAKLTAYAVSDLSPAWARIEAIDCLLDWAEPDPRDRVTNQYLPLSPRPVSIAREALEAAIDQLMNNTEESVREKAVDVASQLGIQKIGPALVSRVQSEEGRPSTRSSALTALARIDSPQAIAMAQKIDGTAPANLQAAALDVLGQYAPNEAVDRLIAATESDSGLLRALAWDWLVKNADPAAEKQIALGVEQYLAGTLPEDVHLNVIEAARARLSSDLTQPIDNHIAEQTKTEPIAKYMASLHGGDPERGAALFMGKTELSCVRCHKVDRAGGEVGPELTVIGKTRDRRWLLEAIVAPDAKIAEGFETAVIANEDGQVFTGIVALENDEVVELILADGARQRIYQDEIIARKKGNSSMPSGLVELMTARELRDLVAYLASLQVDRRAEEIE